MIIRVNIWNQLLGALDYAPERKESYFQYNPEFDLQKYNVAPILMPTNKDGNSPYGPFSMEKDPVYGSLPPMIADALPDAFGNEVFKNWLRINNEDQDTLNPALKLSYIGKRALGALEFEPDMQEKSTPQDIDLQELSALSNLITETNLLPEKITKSVFKELFMVGTSAGGARPKAIVSINFKTRQIVHSTEYLEGFTPILLKFDKPLNESSTESSGVGKIEYVYHKMAVLAGIEMTNCGLFKLDTMSHFYTQRYDRIDNGDKIHSQTLAAVANLNPTHLHDHDEVFETMLQIGLSYGEIEQQFRRMVFNYLSSNDDCHTKNISFLMDKTGEWKLSPAYDITFPYDHKRVWKKTHPISINGKVKDISTEDFFAVGKRFGVKNIQAIIDATKKALNQWETLAEKNKLQTEIIQSIAPYLLRS